MVERLHRRAKFHCRHIVCTKSFESSALALILASRCRDQSTCEVAKLGEGKHKCAPSPMSLRTLCHHHCTKASTQIHLRSGLDIHTCDYVRRGAAIARVLQGVLCGPDHEIRVVVEVFSLVSQPEPFWNIVKTSGVSTSWSLSELRDTIVLAVSRQGMGDGTFDELRCA